MSYFTKMVIFGLVIVGLYTAFAVFYVPGITPEPPPPLPITEPGSMTEAELVSLGARLYAGRGACALCHDTVGHRAPSLKDIAVEAEQRITEARYQGRATDALGYIIESMRDPSAYVVKGYASRGTDGKRSPMPNVTLPPTSLAGFELQAVAAFLQNISGVEVTASVKGKKGAVQ